MKSNIHIMEIQVINAVPYFINQVMKVQVHPRYVEIQSLNQHASELKTVSPVTAESLGPQVKEINDRWNALLKGMYDREVRHEWGVTYRV